MKIIKKSLSFLIAFILTMNTLAVVASGADLVADDDVRNAQLGGNFVWDPATNSWVAVLDFNDLISSPTGECCCTMKDQILTVTGEGKTGDYGAEFLSGVWLTTAPWGNLPLEATFGDGVTSVGECAFYGCKDLRTLNLSSTVVSIGKEAFAWCDSLESVNIPVGVKAINAYTFRNCAKLTAIALPETVATVADEAFGWCSGLTSISLTGNTVAIGNNAFYACDALSDVYFDGTLKQKEKIAIGSGNDALMNANWHFIRCERNGHTYANDTVRACSVCGHLRPAAPDGIEILSTAPEKVVASAMPGCEYRVTFGPWQKEPVFYDLEPVTEYVFYARVAKADGEDAGVMLSIPFVTSKLTPTVAPDAPEAARLTVNSVTLAAVDGVEFSIDGETWQESNVFTGLSPATEYTFLSRYAETATAFPSPSGEPLTCSTKIPGNVDGKDGFNADDVIYLLKSLFNRVTYPVDDGVKYDFNGNGDLDADDVIYLLKALFNPVNYPIY